MSHLCLRPCFVSPLKKTSPTSTCLPVRVRPETAASVPGKEDQDMKQQMFRMHCTALHFRQSVNNRVLEQELCEADWFQEHRSV